MFTSKVPRETRSLKIVSLVTRRAYLAVSADRSSHNTHLHREVIADGQSGTLTMKPGRGSIEKEIAPERVDGANGSEFSW